MTPPLLVVEGMDKSYAGVPALIDARLDVREGEVLGLVGENGAGKSTLVEILAGAVAPDRGVIRVDGQPVPISNTQQSEDLGFRFLHQNLALVDRLSVAENVFLGKTHGHAFFSSRRAQARARQALDGIIDVDPRRTVGSLSVAERWMVALAKACVGDARLVVMDEPTVALSDTEVRTLFRVIDQLRRRGVSVIFVSHRLAEVIEICERVAVMKDGRSLGTYDVKGLDRAGLVSLILGAETADSLQKLESETPPAKGGERVLAVRGLAGGPLHGVDLDLHAGEILGIGGLVGSGRTSLLQQIFGVHRPSTGTVTLEGREGSLKSPTEAIKAGVAYIPEDRRSQALLRLRTLRENTVLSSLSQYRFLRGFPMPSRRRELETSVGTIGKLSIRATGPAQRVEHLSGGNQQKVVIGRALLAPRLRILMLDEPTKGVDIGARFEIYRIIRDLASQGLAVLVVSSDLEELTAISHRVVVLREGEVSGTLEAPMSESDVLGLCF